VIQRRDRKRRRAKTASGPIEADEPRTRGLIALNDATLSRSATKSCSIHANLQDEGKRNALPGRPQRHRQIDPVNVIRGVVLPDEATVYDDDTCASSTWNRTYRRHVRDRL